MLMFDFCQILVDTFRFCKHFKRANHYKMFTPLNKKEERRLIIQYNGKLKLFRKKN